MIKKLSELTDEEILISDSSLVYPAVVIKQAAKRDANWLTGQRWWVMTPKGMEADIEQPVEIDLAPSRHEYEKCPDCKKKMNYLYQGIYQCPNHFGPSGLTK